MPRRRPARSGADLGQLARRCPRPWRRGRRSASASRSSIAASCGDQRVEVAPAPPRAAPSPRARRPRASEIRRSSDSSSCCIRSRSLGLLISPWSIRSWSRLAAGLDLLDVGVDLLLLAREVVDQDPGVAAPGRRPRARLACSGGDLGELGQRAPAGAAAGRARASRSCTSSSVELGERVGFQRGSSGVGASQAERSTGR